MGDEGRGQRFVAASDRGNGDRPRQSGGRGPDAFVVFAILAVMTASLAARASDGPNVTDAEALTKGLKGALGPELRLAPGRYVGNFTVSAAVNVACEKSVPAGRVRPELERTLIRIALEKTGGRRQEAARLLGPEPAAGPLAQLIQWARGLPADAIDLVHIRDWHDPDDPAQREHLERFGAHCDKDTVGARLVLEMDERAEAAPNECIGRRRPRARA